MIYCEFCCFELQDRIMLNIQTMGGYLVSYKPTQLQFSEHVHNILIQYVSIEYFKQLHGFENEVALEFKKSFENKTIMVRNVQV